MKSTATAIALVTGGSRGLGRNIALKLANGGAVRDNAQLNAHLASLSAFGRVGVPDDVGGAVAALLSGGNGWVTGQRIEVSGGTLL